MRVSAIVLAAGESRRMGRAKMTLPFGDSTILATVLERLADSEVGGVTVVLGKNWEEVYPNIQHFDAQIVVNPRPESGMLSSAKWGLAHVPVDSDGFLFALGDQPQILSESIDALIHAAQSSDHEVFLPTYNGRRGHPLLIKSNLKSAILSLPDTGGLNQLLGSEAVQEVPCSSESVLKDIDTRDDYREARIE